MLYVVTTKLINLQENTDTIHQYDLRYQKPTYKDRWYKKPIYETDTMNPTYKTDDAETYL